MIGRTLGSYKIVSQLGAGGMGVVYVAEHPLIGRKAAVKLLLPEYSNNKDLVERFFNEARAATVVKHRGIVDIFDFGYTEDNRAYIVMEFLEGESLSDRIKRGRLSIEEGSRIGRQVASALSAAHEAGIIHRDLKPDNVFLIRDSEVAGGERIKVLDFGIAKLSKHSAPGASKTQTGQLMGSPLYMAPEQCKGAASVDARADVYSLGCVIYEMFSGRPIFDGQAAGEVIAKQIYETPDPPSAFVSGIPPAIESMIMRCLEKQPDARFASMREVIDALDLATHGKHAVAGGKPKTYSNDAVAETVAPSEPPHLLSTPIPTPLPGQGYTPIPTPQPGQVYTPVPTPVPGQVYTPIPTPVPGSGPVVASPPVPAQTTLGTAASEITGARFEVTAQGGRRWGFVAAGLGVLVLAGGIFALTRSGGGDGDSPAPTAAAEPVDPARIASEPMPTSEPPPPVQPTDADVELPARVTIEIASTPSGAAIYRVSDGVRIGKTPYSLEMDRGNGTLDLLVKHSGYRDHPLSVPLAKDRHFELTMESKRSSSRRGSGATSAKPAEVGTKPQVTTKPEPAKPVQQPVAEKEPPPKPVEQPVAKKDPPKKPDEDGTPEKPKPRKDKEWGKTYNPLED